MQCISDHNGRADTRDLVSLAASGDHHAYADLVGRYKDNLYRLALQILCRPADAEDAVQDTFIKAYIHLDSYRDAYSFYTWLSAILTNNCYSVLRARDWQVASMPDRLLQAMRVVDPLDEPETAFLMRSRDEVIRRALESLPEKYRRILILRYWSDLTYREVADATQQSLGAVKTQIRRATLLLKEALVGFQPELVAEA